VLLYTGQRGQLTQETELLDSLIEKVENQVAHSSKKELISRSEELLTIFKQVSILAIWLYLQQPFSQLL